MADHTFDEMAELVDQLTQEEKDRLATHLLEVAQERPLTKEERIALFRASILNTPVANTPSPRREDWYDDDGR